MYMCSSSVILVDRGIVHRLARVREAASVFRGGLVFKTHRLLHHSTLGLRVIKKKRSIIHRLPRVREAARACTFVRKLVCGVSCQEIIQGQPVRSTVFGMPLMCIYSSTVILVDRGIIHRLSRVREAAERAFFIDNLLVRIQFIIEMIWWTGHAPWEFESRFPGSLTSTFLGEAASVCTFMSGNCPGEVLNSTVLGVSPSNI